MRKLISPPTSKTSGSEPSKTLATTPVVVGAAALTGAALGLGWYLAKSGRLSSSGKQPTTGNIKDTEKGGEEARVRQNTPPRLGAPVSGINLHPSSYPWGRREEAEVEVWHGVKVPDPYRWLEDPSVAEGAAFGEAQTTLTNSVLAELSSLPHFKKLLTEVTNAPRYGCPSCAGDGFIFYSYNAGLSEHDLIYMQKGLDGESKILLDPSDWSDDGSLALKEMAFSKDGSLLACSIVREQSGWETIRVMRIAWDANAQSSEQIAGSDDLDEKLCSVKHSKVAWTHDNKGFFYCRYPGQGMDSTDSKLLNHQLCYHVLGTPQKEDKVVFACPENPSWLLNGKISDEGRYLIVTIHEGYGPGNRVCYLDLQKIPSSNGVLNFADCDFITGEAKVPMEVLVESTDAQYEFICNDGSEFTFHCNFNAPRYKVARTSLNRNENPSQWREVVPQHESDVLEWASAVKGDNLVVCFIRDCCNILQLRNLTTGELKMPIDLNGFGSIGSFFGSQTYSDVFFTYSTYTEPPVTYHFNAEDMKCSAFTATTIKGYNPDDLETKQVLVKGWDGSQIPMFITHKKDMKMSGTNPTLMFVGNDFADCMLPSFSLAKICFVLGCNGVLASVNVRGGKEYGTSWFLKGAQKSLQNRFDDFMCCAEYLINANYTSPQQLGIEGSYHGGLVVAVSAVHRPDLFCCVLAEGAILDMLRYPEFSHGALWTRFYGDPSQPEEFPTLYRTCPVHSVQVPEGGTLQFPAVLLTTGDHDDRVSPSHTLKFIASLQYTLGHDREGPQTNPLCAKLTPKVGCGIGKPTSKVIKETSEKYAFLITALKAEWAME